MQGRSSPLTSCVANEEEGIGHRSPARTRESLVHTPAKCMIGETLEIEVTGERGGSTNATVC